MRPKLKLEAELMPEPEPIRSRDVLVIASTCLKALLEWADNLDMGTSHVNYK
jgi:hypothetical protein